MKEIAAPEEDHVRRDIQVFERVTALGVCSYNKAFDDRRRKLWSILNSAWSFVLCVEMDSSRSANAASVAPSSVTDAVLKPSDAMPEGSQKVEELDFNKFKGRSVTVEELMSGMTNMGFQASSIGEAVRIINDMVCTIFSSCFMAKGGRM